MIQTQFAALACVLIQKSDLLKNGMVIRAYNHHARLLPPEPPGRQATKVYSGRGSRYGCEIKFATSLEDVP
jgi:hypothetical protein